MSHRDVPPSQPNSDAGVAASLRVTALVGADRSLGTAALLLEAPGLSVSEAASLWELLELARGGSVAAIVADPEQGEGWTVDVAEQIVIQAQGVVPVTLICRHAADAQLIEQRVNRQEVSVLLHEGLTAQQLGSIVAGAVAMHRARPKTSAPS